MDDPARNGGWGSREMLRVLRAAAQALHDGMVLLDRRWRVVAANGAASELLGVSAERLATCPPLDGLGLRLADGTAFDRSHRGLVMVRDGKPSEELRLLSGPVDSPTWIDARVVPVAADAPGQETMVLTLRDVTRSVEEAGARREAEGRLRLQAQLLEAVGQAVFAVDRAGIVIHWNAAAEELYGWKASEVMGTDVVPIVEEVVGVDSVPEQERRAAMRRGEPWSGEVELRRRDGSTFVALVSASPFRDQDGTVAGVISVATDISARIAAERHANVLAAQHAAVASVGELAITETDLRVVFDRSCELVAEVLAADVVSLLLRQPQDEVEVDELRLVAGVGFRDGEVGEHRVPIGSRSMAGFTLHREEAVVVEDLSSEERFEPPWLLQALGVVNGIATVVRSEGRPVGVLSAYRTSPEQFDGDAVHVLQSISNVIARAIERDAARLALSQLALTDQLTGLPNRALFQDRLNHLLAHRDHRSFAVLFIDLDGFKDVNDALGHEAGDEVLRVVARRLRELCREADTLARLGGDEFAVLCEDVGDVAAAAELGERLIRFVSRRPVPLGDRELRVRMSVGVAMATERAGSSALLRDADMAMYRAKAAGGSRVRVFDDQMRLSAVERLSLASDLRASIDRQQLAVHYQPQVELAGSRIWAEALVRWDHPERGMLAPGQFIGLAEETGFVVELGHWVLEQAVAQMAAWRRLGEERAPSSVSVNLSTWQLLEGDIVRLTAELLAQHDLDPGCLYFELTETALLREPEQSLAALDALKGLGVGLAIDDFGTGYSSLRYIRTLPVDVVKIDRGFVGGVGVDRRDDGIVDAIVAMATSFGILTIAEGVETAAQLERLTELGCDFAQGYLLARPGPAGDVERWVAARS